MNTVDRTMRPTTRHHRVKQKNSRLIHTSKLRTTNKFKLNITKRNTMISFLSLPHIDEGEREGGGEE